MNFQQFTLLDRFAFRRQIVASFKSRPVALRFARSMRIFNRFTLAFRRVERAIPVVE
jgi:hypothetical protein